MNRCPTCGKKISDEATFCPACGSKMKREEDSFKTFNYTHTNNEPNKYTYHPSNDNPSHFAGVISCCFPIVGLVLYFVWKDEKPDSAQLVCQWMIVGFVAWFVLNFFAFILGIAGM